MATKAKEELTVEQKLAALEAREAELAALEAREAELAAKEAAFNVRVVERQGGGTTPEVDPLIAINEGLEEKFPIKLFKDSKDYIEPLFVSVNGDTILIKRGVEVMVKKKHLLVIKSSEAQDQATSDLIEALQEEYRESLKQIT